MEFAKASGPKQYDWRNKATFLLSAKELGGIIAAGQNAGVSFVHDPKQDGQMLKTLSINPGKEGTFFASVKVNSKQNPAENKEVSIPIGKDDYAVMMALFNHAIPHLFGWGLVFDPIVNAGNSMPDNTSVSE